MFDTPFLASVTSAHAAHATTSIPASTMIGEAVQGDQQPDVASDPLSVETTTAEVSTMTDAGNPGAPELASDLSQLKATAVAEEIGSTSAAAIMIPPPAVRTTTSNNPVSSFFQTLTAAGFPLGTDLPTTLQTSSSQLDTATPSPQPQSPSSFDTAISSYPSVSNTAAAAAATSSSAQYDTDDCDHDVDCAGKKKTDDHHGAIAGGAIGGIAFLIIVFAMFMLLRRSRRKAAEEKIEGGAVWSEKSRTDSDDSSKALKDPETGLAYKNRNAQGRTKMNTTDELDGPGPAVDNGDEYATLLVTQSSPNTSSASDPFRSPASVNALISLNKPQPTQSKIGLALTRYSTGETLHAALNSHPPSPGKHDLLPAKSEESFRTAPVPNHKRISSLSAQTDVTDTTNRESDNTAAQTFCIGKARTARRHSLTPRIINIVANQDGSPGNDGHSTKSVDSNGEYKANRRRLSDRARSVSPARALQKLNYSGSPAKLNSHFGIETWGLQPGRTSSEKMQRENSTGSVAGMQRGRSTKKAGDMDNGHINNPPTSYPSLGRTMSEVKRTIRAKKDEAFLGSVTSMGSGSMWDGAKRKLPGV